MTILCLYCAGSLDSPGCHQLWGRVRQIRARGLHKGRHVPGLDTGEHVAGFTAKEEHVASLLENM